MEISISKAGIEVVDRLEPLWLALHEHHQKVVPDAVYQPRDASWKARRTAYTEWLAAPGSFVLLAEAKAVAEAEAEAVAEAKAKAKAKAKAETLAGTTANPDADTIAEPETPVGGTAGAEADTGAGVATTELLGYALVQVRPGPDDTWVTGSRMAELQTLSVAPEARGRGVGSMLLDRVDAELDAAGIGDLFIAALHGNDGAIRLYERRGLRPVAIHLARFAADKRRES